MKVEKIKAANLIKTKASSNEMRDKISMMAVSYSAVSGGDDDLMQAAKQDTKARQNK
jgi:hypothetical protein